MYSKIYNPETGRKVSIFGNKGNEILKNYLNNVLSGGSKSSYNCKLGEEGVDGKITKKNCKKQYDPLNLDKVSNYNAKKYFDLLDKGLVSKNEIVSRCILTKNGYCRKRQNSSKKRAMRNIKLLKMYLPKILIKSTKVKNIVIDEKDNEGNDIVLPIMHDNELELENTKPSLWNRLKTSFYKSFKSGTKLAEKSIRIASSIFNGINLYKEASREIIININNFILKLNNYLENRGSSGIITSGPLITGYTLRKYREIERHIAIKGGFCNKKGEQLADIDSDSYNKYIYQFMFRYVTDKGEERYIDEISPMSKSENHYYSKIMKNLDTVVDENNKDIPNFIKITHEFEKIKENIQALLDEIYQKIYKSAEEDDRNVEQFVEYLENLLGYEHETINIIRLESFIENSIEKINKDLLEISGYKIDKSLSGFRRINNILALVGL